VRTFEDLDPGNPYLIPATLRLPESETPEDCDALGRRSFSTIHHRFTGRRLDDSIRIHPLAR